MEDIEINNEKIGAILIMINALVKDIKSVTLGEATITLVTKKNEVYSFCISELIKKLTYELYEEGSKHGRSTND